MDTALIVGCALMGLAGSPHCVAMCGPSCAALTGCPAAAAPEPVHTTTAAQVAFQTARAGSYAVAGALAAGGLGALTLATQTAPVMRPVWTLVHIAALALGLWMLATGRQPAVFGTLMAPRSGAMNAPWQTVSGPGTTARRVLVTRAALGGSAWVAWPCGLLQSAIVVAALCRTPAAGAAAMTAFALASAPALVAAPWAWRQWLRRTGKGERAVTWVIRLAGAALAAASVVALLGDRWEAFAAYCGF